MPRRHLTLIDLIAIGVGGTVGSGIFVLTGQIAAENAGPLTFVSFAISGLAACCSGVCYAELSGRLPAEGSTYVYAYVCLGEVAAVIAAACLTLEYAVAGAAVARSWGDKLILWMEPMADVSWMEAEMVNLPACGISLLSTFLLLKGVQESKNVTNFFTLLKMILVAFMTIGGFCLWQPKNMMQRPLAPYGAGGVLRGATSSFFGYLGCKLIVSFQLKD
jgi:amino acid transporter